MRTLQNHRTRRTSLTLAFSALLLGAVLAVATPAPAFHTNLPVIHSVTVAGSAAFGVRVDMAEAGDLALDVEGYAPRTSSQLSGGAAFFDENQNLEFMFAFTSHSSPDRLIVTAGGVQPAEGSEPGEHVFVAEGDPNVLSEYETVIEGAEPDQRLIALGTTTTNAAAGSHYFILWLGGVGATTFTVSTAADARVAVIEGNALAIGDPEITEGNVNVQAQQTVQGQRVGAKIMQDATYEVEVEHALYGFWGASDFKLVCQFVVGACVWASAVVNPALLSWSGPNGTGGSGGSLYSFLGLGAGDYAFTVDLKIEVYGPNVFNSQTGTWVFLGENYSFLTIADARLP